MIAADIMTLETAAATAARERAGSERECHHEGLERALGWRAAMGSVTVVAERGL